MDDFMQPIADADQAVADSDMEIHVEATEDPSDTEESESTSIAALRLASACDTVARVFFTVLSAAMVTGLVYVLVLKPSSTPIDVPFGDLRAAPGSWMADPDDEDDMLGTPVGRVAPLRSHNGSLWSWANMSDDSDDDDGDVSSSNMTMEDELWGTPPDFTLLPDWNDTQNLDDVV
ncbi:hypothetical protein MRX96_009856 [Rhipicephalus microplus]